MDEKNPKNSPSYPKTLTSSFLKASVDKKVSYFSFLRTFH